MSGTLSASDSFEGPQPPGKLACVTRSIAQLATPAVRQSGHAAHPLASSHGSLSLSQLSACLEWNAGETGNEFHASSPRDPVFQLILILNPSMGKSGGLWGVVRNGRSGREGGRRWDGGGWKARHDDGRYRSGR